MVLCLLAMMRSGHHGVLRWLVEQLPQPVRHINGPSSFLNPNEKYLNLFRGDDELLDLIEQLFSDDSSVMEAIDAIC